MILTAAAGARVETTALRIEEEGRPPKAMVEVPMGCQNIVCSATDSTLENTADIDDALTQDGQEFGHKLLRVRVPRVGSGMEASWPSGHGVAAQWARLSSYVTSLKRFERGKHGRAGMVAGGCGGVLRIGGTWNHRHREFAERLSRACTPWWLEGESIRIE